MNEPRDTMLKCLRMGGLLTWISGSTYSVTADAAWRTLGLAAILMLLVPFLTMLMTAQGVPVQHVVHMAIATSLATIMFTSVSSVRAIGISLFTDYAFAFEVTSLLILVAMVGAVVLAVALPPQHSVPT